MSITMPVPYKLKPVLSNGCALTVPYLATEQHPKPLMQSIRTVLLRPSLTSNQPRQGPALGAPDWRQRAAFIILAQWFSKYRRQTFA